MKITILGLNKQRKTGLETWKSNLVKELSVKNEVLEVDTLNWIPSLIKIPSVLNSEICQSYSQSTLTIFFLFLRKLLKKKNIHTIHGDYYEENENKTGIKKIFWIPFNRLCNLLSDKIIFPSEYLLNMILKHEPKIKNKSSVIPNGIDMQEIKLINGYKKEEIGVAKDTFLIMEITNFNLIKKARGVDQLVRDFKKIKNTKAQLYIIGGGKYLDYYKKKYESKRIVFLGFKKEAIKYLKACDLFVHYSFLDSFGYVLLEAIACNKPVLAVGSPAFKEIISVSNRLNSSNYNKLSNLIAENNKHLYKYTLNKMGTKYEQVYKETIREFKNKNQTPHIK